MNLYCVVHLCAAAELRPVPNANDTSNVPAQGLSATVMKIAETVRALSVESGDENSRTVQSTSQNQLNSVTLAAVAANATSAFSRGTSSASFILPFLHQRAGMQWVRVRY